MNRRFELKKKYFIAIRMILSHLKFRLMRNYSCNYTVYLSLQILDVFPRKKAQIHSGFGWCK